MRVLNRPFSRSTTSTSRAELEPEETPPVRAARVTRRPVPASLELTTCPQCAGPAAVLDRFTLASTSGPVEYVRISCLLEHHHFTMPTPRIARSADRPTEEDPR